MLDLRFIGSMTNVEFLDVNLGIWPRLLNDSADF